MNKLLLLIFSLMLVVATGIKSNAQEPALSNLMVQELQMNDTIVDFVLLEFDCTDISAIASVEYHIVKDMNTEMAMPEQQTLSIFNKEGKYFIRLLNNEEIEIKNNHIGFVTPLGETTYPIPFTLISIKAKLKNGSWTNELIHIRN